MTAQGAGSAARPHFPCRNCKLGNATLYGPTVAKIPDAVTHWRNEVRAVKPGRILIREGDISRSISTILSGWALQYMQLPDGRRQIIQFLIPGDLVAFESLCFPSYSLPFFIKSLTELSLCVFPLETIAKLMQGDEAQRDQFDLARRQYVSRLHQRLLGIGRRSAIGRMAHLLIDLEERLAKRGLVDDGRFNFPARQQHLADALGLTPVHVSRTIGALRKRRLIDLQSQVMIIYDRGALLRVANEE